MTQFCRRTLWDGRFSESEPENAKEQISSHTSRNEGSEGKDRKENGTTVKENIVIVNFSVESEAYQALSEVKERPITNDFTILQAQIVKNVNGKLELKDGFSTDLTTSDDTLNGGLIGSLVGILGGPLGVLFGWSMGSLIGGGIDADDAVNEASLLDKAGESIIEGETALLLLVQGESEEGLNRALAKYQVTVTRFDAAEIAAEVDHAREVERQTAVEARKKLRAQKTEAFKENVEKKSKAIKEKFEKFVNKK